MSCGAGEEIVEGWSVRVGVESNGGVEIGRVVEAGGVALAGPRRGSE